CPTLFCLPLEGKVARPTGVTDEVAGVSLNEKHLIHHLTMVPLPLKGKAVLQTLLSSLKKEGFSPSFNLLLKCYAVFEYC
ncbi:MAG: hypothetical protein J6M16_07680, partial [Clostridia bacterium]|nr:hypothetical protein [Clostridia bacterium]